jgi:hypothetical protein
LKGAAISLKSGSTIAIVVGAFFTVVGVGVMGLYQLAAAQRGVYFMCVADAGTDGLTPGVSWRLSFFPRGFTCLYHGQPVGFHDLGTVFAVLALVGILIVISAVVIKLSRRSARAQRSI